MQVRDSSERVLGASVIGEKCKRKLVLLSFGIEVPVSERLQRVFDVGKSLEGVVVEWLKRDGWQVWYGGSERDVDFRVRVGDGYVVGKVDLLRIFQGGIGRVYDVKVVSLENYERFLQGEGELLEKYVVQGNLYVWGLSQVDISKLTDGVCRELDRERWGLVVVSRERCSYEVLEFGYDEGVVEESLRKVEEVFCVRRIEDFVKVDSRGEEKCRWCNVRDICWELELMGR